MPKPQTGPRLTLEAVRAEIEELTPQMVSPVSRWSPEHDKILLHLMEKGWSIPNIVKWWDEKFGWGSETAIKRRRKKLMEEAGK